MQALAAAALFSQAFLHQHALAEEVDDDPFMCNAHTYICKRQSQGGSGDGWYAGNWTGDRAEEDCDGECVPTFGCSLTEGECPRFPACVGPYTPNPTDPNPTDPAQCGDQKVYSDCEAECDTTVAMLYSGQGTLQPSFSPGNLKYTVQEEPDVRYVSFNITARNKRIKVFANGSPLDGIPDPSGADLWVWSTAPNSIPISNGVTAVTIAVGLLPDATKAVRTYTVEVNQKLPTLCREAAPNGSLTFVVKDCAETCTRLHGGGVAPIPTGNFQWALSDSEVGQFLTALFNESSSVEPPFEALSVSIKTLIAGFAEVESKQTQMVEAVQGITEEFTANIRTIDNSFANCVFFPGTKDCAPATNITGLMYQTYRGLLHKNASLREAAIVLHTAAVRFNTTYNTEVVKLLKLQQDLKDSLASKASIRQLGNASALCLAAGTGFRESVKCGCVGSNLVSTYKDPCDDNVTTSLVAKADHMYASGDQPRCSDIQADGSVKPGSGDGSVVNTLKQCERLCNKDDQASAPLVFGSIDYNVEKKVVDDVLRQLFPEGANLSPPFINVKGNLSALRYKLVDVEARTQPLHDLLDSVTQSLITKVPGDDQKFSQCWNGGDCGGASGIVDFMEKQYSQYLAPLRDANAEKIWAELRRAASSFEEFLTTFQQSMDFLMSELDQILEQKVDYALGLVMSPMPFCQNLVQGANMSTYCACSNSLLSASAEGICENAAPKFTCINGTCVSGPDGSFDTYGSCESTCTGGHIPPAPTPPPGPPPGPPPTPPPTSTKYNCYIKTYTCEPAHFGAFTSKDDCVAACKKTNNTI